MNLELNLNFSIELYNYINNMKLFYNYIKLIYDICIL